MKKEKGEMMVKQNIILTSMLALVIASPAMAAVGDVITTGAQCTIGDLGVSSGTANATAQFTINTYQCAAGTYLPSGTSWTTDTQYTNNNCAPCPANSYCPGSGNTTFTYSASNNQGITACSGTYTLSDTNSTSADSCYRECTTSDVAHSNTVTGRFYSNETAQSNSCVPATCVTGYSVQSFDPSTVLPATSTNATDYRYKSNNGEDAADYDDGGTGTSDLANGEWEVKWDDGNKTGKLRGIASCNSTAGRNDDFTWANPSTLPANTNLASTSTTGRYCWCKPTSWTPSGGAEQSLSAAWVFYHDYGDASGCAGSCALDCAGVVYGGGAFRSALFGGVGASPQCVANNITLSWNNENGTQFTSGSCTYDESLTVPSTHPDKRGYTFTGWKFVSPSQN
jgi:hypothetical protein